jgi:hypothetical protein
VTMRMIPAGFEPALPKETELKSVALDHSAMKSLVLFVCLGFGFCGVVEIARSIKVFAGFIAVTTRFIYYYKSTPDGARTRDKSLIRRSLCQTELREHLISGRLQYPDY